MKKLVSLIACSVFVLVTMPFHIASAQSDSITRGDFFTLIVEELQVPTLEEKFIPASKYNRIPAHQIPIIDALDRRNALKVFNNNFAPSRTITRAEAARVIVELQNLTTTKSIGFRDVSKNTLEEKAIAVVVNKGWLQPLRPNYFGADSLLTLNEARLMIGKMTGKNLPEDTDGLSPTVVGNGTPKITVKFTPSSKKSTAIPKAELVEVIWQLLQEEYLYDEKLDETEIAYSMIESMVKAADDPYTSFLRPQSSADFQTQLAGRVTGIGAQVEERNGLLTIVAPLPGSPAEKSGLLPNDQIVGIDGVSILDIPFPEAINKIRGVRGTIVRLTVRRNGGELYFNVQREVVRVPDYEIQWNKDVAIVKIMQFGQITKTELRSELQKAVAKNPRGIVLDLRNNPGGLLDAAGEVASFMLPKGTVYAKISQKKSVKTSVTPEDPIIPSTTPMVVLINAGSASASEIVAGALQDQKRAKVIGQTSFGKGTVQQVIQFTDNSSIKMTIAEWLTPLGRKIDHIGITPDIEISPTADRDAVLLKALELLK